MRLPHYLSICGFVILFFGLFLFARTKPSKIGKAEIRREAEFESTSFEILKKEAYTSIDDNQLTNIHILDAQLRQEIDTVAKLGIMKKIAGIWANNGFFAVSGGYAEKIAEFEMTDEAWGIAATTYYLGLKNEKNRKEKQYCKQRALKAYDIALSLQPKEIRHQLNKAILLAEFPDENNAMKGISMLLELNKDFPNNVNVLNQLAKFGIQTKQYDNAKARLLKALELENNNLMSNCLMFQLMKETNNQQLATEYRIRCDSLNINK